VRLETPRLLLRRFEGSDLEDFAAMQADPEVTRFVRAMDRRQCEERLRQDEVDWRERGHGLLAVFDRRSGEFLGRTGLRLWPQFGETEVGWVLRREAWGNGFATEAARACLEWGLRDFDFPYLTAMIEPANERSIRVAERIGMAPLREDVLLDADVIVYVRRPPSLDSDPASRRGSTP
jgi:RimJ/RimL family protein N-acetyltransferase